MAATRCVQLNANTAGASAVNTEWQSDWTVTEANGVKLSGGGCLCRHRDQYYVSDNDRVIVVVFGATTFLLVSDGFARRIKMGVLFVLC